MRDLKADLEICNKATAGPWEATSESDEDVRVCQTENEECVCCLALMGDYNWEKEEWKEGSIKQWNKDAEFIAASREGWPEAIERAINAEAEVERLRMALDKLANPLKYMQMEARAKGAELNGVYAIMLSKDPNYLQEIALAELDKEDER